MVCSLLVVLVLSRRRIGSSVTVEGEAREEVDRVRLRFQGEVWDEEEEV